MVGTSASVLNAYHFMSQPDAAGVNEREAIRRSLRRQDVFSARLRGALDLLRGAGSLFESQSLRRLIMQPMRVELLEGRVDVFLAPHLRPLDVFPVNFSGPSTLIDRPASTARARLATGGLRRPAVAKTCVKRTPARTSLYRFGVQPRLSPNAPMRGLMSSTIIGTILGC